VLTGTRVGARGRRSGAADGTPRSSSRSVCPAG